ncbi:hypothetical protein LEP3755_57150 [Leptolyngbya sp. NIES-3755]|nr:hypothetical protein LEP3755_57150 [Leptolyngbya sp. NIES-3755]
MTSDSPNAEYTIQFSPLAREMLGAVRDQRELKILGDRIDKLKIEPEKQGKALVGKLLGYGSVRAVGQRYRVIYRVEQDTVGSTSGDDVIDAGFTKSK